jgi:hypothetical protein
MNKFREGEAQDLPLRKGRFAQRDGEWFLTTRENIELGPFESHAEASMCLDEYLSFVNGADPIELEQFYKIFAAA